MGLRDETITLTGLELHRLLRQYAKERLLAAGFAHRGSVAAVLEAGASEEVIQTARAFACAGSLTAAKAFVQDVVNEKAAECNPG